MFTQDVWPYCLGAKDQCYPCMAKGYNRDLCGDHSNMYCNGECVRVSGSVCLYLYDSVVYDCHLSHTHTHIHTHTATGTLGQGAADMCHATTGQTGMVAGWEALSTDESVLKGQLFETGPLSVLLNAVQLQFYHSGVFNPTHCDPTQLDHAVLMVGYGTTSDGQDFWKIKNSWGTRWGLDGYFNIARGTGECGINTAAVSAIIK
jgi:hypothetical protein